jgi:3-deoxy-D-manno-octulosonate 8-phosphate phosphatase (KDO 8-P phosphatase)
MGAADAIGAAARVELLVLDVDGVLTDGRIAIDGEGRELKSFHAADGAGIKYFQRVGKRVAFISGRSSPAVTARAAELGVTIVHQDAKDKLPVYLRVLEELALDEAQAAVMGDDLMDLPLMRRCGLAIAPANAAAEVRAAAAMVTGASGGAGAVREAVEAILRAGGLWDQILQRYVK